MPQLTFLNAAARLSPSRQATNRIFPGETNLLKGETKMPTSKIKFPDSAGHHITPQPGLGVSKLLRTVVT